MNQGNEKRRPGRPIGSQNKPKTEEKKVEAEPKTDGNAALEPEPQPQPEKIVEKIIAASGDERSIAASLDAASKPWTEEKEKQVVESIDPLAFTEPQKVVLDRIKELHRNFNVKYRFIEDNKERISKAIHVEHWRPVNRTSHPKTPDDLINDRFGCVECMGQILMFRPETVDKAFIVRPLQLHREKMKDLDEKSEFDDRFYKPKSGDRPGKAFFQDEDSTDKNFINDFVEAE